jgi:hypothetical protein
MALGIMANLLTGCLYKGSWISSFGVIYQLQIIMMFPLIGADMGDDVLAFYRFIRHLLFSMSFLPKNFVFFSLGHYIDVFEFPQTNWYLFLLNIDDGSAFVNLRELTFTLCIIGVIYILFALSYSCTKDQEPDSNRHVFFKKCYDFVATKLIVRTLMLGYMYLLICSLSEIAHTDRIIHGFPSYLIA